MDRGTQVLLDTRITEELALEGLAREVIRQVQEARKDADLQMEDRIVVYLATGEISRGQYFILLAPFNGAISNGFIAA